MTKQVAKKEINKAESNKAESNKDESNKDVAKLIRDDYHAYDKQLDSMKYKSTKIRFLLSKRWTRSDISKKLDIIYQHVRNVEIQIVKQAKEDISKIK